jgi:predicted dehydrogenase
MATRLGVGVCGLGAFGESHLRAYRGLPLVEVVAVASRSAERAREVAARYDVPRCYDSYDALIADPAVQAVSVTTAETEHLAPALAALAAGKPVLVEKPLAVSLEDGRALVEAARRSSAFLLPGHILRFDVRYAALRASVAAGELGRLTSLSARRNRPSELVASHSRVHPALVTSIHDLDIMLWLTASPAASVRAYHRLGSRPGDPHGIWAILRFGNDVVATIESVWMTPDTTGIATEDAFGVIGTGGVGQIRAGAPALQIATEDGPRAPDLYYEPTVHGASAGALKEELAYFALCASTGMTPEIVTAEDGLNALALALAMIESAERDAEIGVGGRAARDDRNGGNR